MATADALDDGDSALLSELLALIDGDDGSERGAEETTAEAAKLPLKAASRSAKAPTGRMREIALLHAEAQQLTEQLTRLRDSHAQKEGLSIAKERALSERRKRQRAETECRHLRDAVFRQKLFIRGLRSVFSGTQRFSQGLDLCHYLHRPMRLPLNRTDRWGKFNAKAHDARIESAVDVLCRETDSISLEGDATPLGTPYVHCELLDDATTRSTTYTAVYAIDTQDVAAVVRAVCVAIRDVGTICPSGHALRVSRDIVDADAPSESNVLYRVMRIGHQCATTGEEIEVASHVVTSYKVTQDYGVVLWDFVDDDERHPVETDAAVNVTRETTGACLVRRERCSDGVERVLLRSLGTKKFRFRNAKSVAKHGRIACITRAADAMVRGDELLFRRLVLAQLAAEEAMTVQVAQV